MIVVLVKMGGRNVVPTYLPSTAVGIKKKIRFLHLVSLMVRILNSGSTGVLSVEPTGTCNGDLKNIIRYVFNVLKGNKRKSTFFFILIYKLT
jgi:hypothetical protein